MHGCSKSQLSSAQLLSSAAQLSFEAVNANNPLNIDDVIRYGGMVMIMKTKMNDA